MRAVLSVTQVLVVMGVLLLACACVSRVVAAADSTDDRDLDVDVDQYPDIDTYLDEDADTTTATAGSSRMCSKLRDKLGLGMKWWGGDMSMHMPLMDASLSYSLPLPCLFGYCCSPPEFAIAAGWPLANVAATMRPRDVLLSSLMRSNSDEDAAAGVDEFVLNLMEARVPDACTRVCTPNTLRGACKRCVRMCSLSCRANPRSLQCMRCHKPTPMPMMVPSNLMSHELDCAHICSMNPRSRECHRCMGVGAGVTGGDRCSRYCRMSPRSLECRICHTMTTTPTPMVPVPAPVPMPMPVM